MCLAKAYVRSEAARPDPAVGGPAGSDAAGSGARLSETATLLMENVTQVDVDGDRVRLRSLFGDTESLLGRIASVDFVEGKLVLER